MKLPSPDQLHTTEQAAVVLEVPAGLIRSWRHRGKAMPSDFIQGAVKGGWIPLFKLEELEPLAIAYHARRTTPRRSETGC